MRTVSVVMSTAQLLSGVVEQNLPLTAPRNTTALSARRQSLKSNKIINIRVNHTLKAVPSLVVVKIWKRFHM